MRHRPAQPLIPPSETGRTRIQDSEVWTGSFQQNFAMIIHTRTGCQGCTRAWGPGGRVVTSASRALTTLLSRWGETPDNYQQLALITDSFWLYHKILLFCLICPCFTNKNVSLMNLIESALHNVAWCQVKNYKPNRRFQFNLDELDKLSNQDKLDLNLI